MKKILIAALVLFSVLTIFLLMDKNRFENYLKESLDNLRKNLRAGDAGVIRMEGIEKVCLQGPYMSESDFNAGGGSAIFFKKLNSDQEFIIHLYPKYRNYQILIKGNAVRLNTRNLAATCHKGGNLLLKNANNLFLLDFE